MANALGEAIERKGFIFAQSMTNNSADIARMINTAAEVATGAINKSLKDIEANALAVNALQRRADVIVQHSLREGFGLTVTEAMWKSKPVVASNIDGLARQIEHEVHGLLTRDPADLAELGDAIVSLLEKPGAAMRLGAAARDRCEREFLCARETSDYLKLYDAVLE